MNWYRKLPDAWKAAINTAWQSAVGAFLLSLLGFLHDVQEWAGGAAEFPSVTPLGKAVMAALVGAVAGLITVVHRSIKAGPVYPGTPPADPPKDVGATDLGLLIWLLRLFAFGAFLIAGFIANGWIDADAYAAWLAFGLAAWCLATWAGANP